MIIIIIIIILVMLIIIDPIITKGDRNTDTKGADCAYAVYKGICIEIVYATEYIGIRYEGYRRLYLYSIAYCIYTVHVSQIVSIQCT